MVSGAWADMQIFSSHRSIVDLADGKPDYSTARFLSMWVEALGYDGQATQADVNLTGTMTFSDGDYSFWDSKNGMRHISGASHTFGLAAGSWVNVGSAPEYVPMTASGDNVVFCLEADGGLNGVNVSWSFPDKPDYSGTGTVPHYRTTQSQLESYVPYVEYVRSGSQVSGLRWRIVSPDNTAEAVALDFESWFVIDSVQDADGTTLYSGSWTDIEAGNPVSGEATFDSPLNEADISRIRVAFNRWNEDSENSYQWFFCNPSEPEPWLYENHSFTASLVNGKSDYSNVKSDRIFFDVRVSRGIIAEAKHFTADASMTIPGGGYSLADNDTDEDLGVTVPVGTDKTFKLRMGSSVAPGDTSLLEFQPIDENGANLHFEGGAEGGGENLVGRTITWTFPEDFGLSGSAKVSSFKSAVQFLATAVPYVELVSADGKLTAVNFRMVASSDTSTALELPYRTNFRLRFDRIVPDEVKGKYYYSSWRYNESSGTWTLGQPQDLSNMECVTVRLWSWEEDADDSLKYQWHFYPAEAPAPLEITTASLPDATVNASYTATLAANLPGATWSVSSGTLPAGLTLNSSTGTISGISTTAGTATFTVTATLEGHGSAEKTFTLTVSQTPTPQTVEITTTTIPEAVAGMSYNAELESNPEGATWTLSGNLPAGLVLDSSGRISGTPTVAGEFRFTVTARYGTASDVRTLTLTVKPLEITTETLPGGTVGDAYNETLTSNGSGLTWTVSAGTLPAGLTLNGNTGLLSGTLTEAGEYTFTVYAHNTHASASKQFTVNVSNRGTGGHGGGCSSFTAVFGAGLLAVILKRR